MRSFGETEHPAIPIHVIAITTSGTRVSSHTASVATWHLEILQDDLHLAAIDEAAHQPDRA
jgi:hypothetical protein